MDIPVSYLQLDPWWFQVSWTARSDYFPDGLRSFQDNIDVPLLLYSYFWSTHTPAAYNYSYKFEDAYNYFHRDTLFHMTQVSPQDSRRFYGDIFGEYADVMGGTEIDFSNYMPTLWPSFNADPGAIEQWAAGLAGAALEQQVSVQYCMPLPCQLLIALQLPAVTNARASGDNFPVAYQPGGNPDRWMIPYTSILLSAMAIRPFMDVIWTAADQPGNPYNVSRHNIELQVLLLNFAGLLAPLVSCLLLFVLCLCPGYRRHYVCRPSRNWRRYWLLQCFSRTFDC